jgi:hypothetical protein
MTGQHREGTAALSALIANRLASPADVGDLGATSCWWPQSLAHGAAGIALLHVERARGELASWQRAHDWLRFATRQEISGGDGSHLYHGAPALAFALHGAADPRGRYARALELLDRRIATATRRRLDRAHKRIDAGELPALAEFDTIRGLTGIGAHLLRRDPTADLVRIILEYLVRLTEPITDDGETLPGWWTDLAPTGRPAPEFPGGHGNLGMAHGIGGPLAMLSLAARRGILVDGQREAIRRICDWLDHWRQDGESGPWWPYWVTRAQLRAGRVALPGPARLSWCYGTPGLVRAQQLAALATADTERQQMAEQAFASALLNPAQLAATVDASLCHGHAGLLHLARYVAADATTADLAACVPRLLDNVLATMRADGAGSDLAAGPGAAMFDRLGLLEGLAGIGLALHGVENDPPSDSGWDACLLIN